MTALPAVFDTLVSRLTAAVGAGLVFDGPPTQYIGSRGVSVGATRDIESVEWFAPPADLVGSGETLTIRCLAWSGSGDTVFKPHRDAVATLLVAADRVLAGDRTIGGSVSTAWITGGTWVQELTGNGALVTCQFAVDCTVF